MDYINNLNDRRSVASNAAAARSSVRQSAQQNARDSARQSVRQSALPARSSILPPSGPARQSFISTRQSLMSTRQSILSNGRLSVISGRGSLLPNGRLSAVPLAAGRIKQQREAKAQEKAVHDRAKATGIPIPPYDFLEIIGKGSFGRVFKSRRKDDRTLVALKIIEVDKSDYEAAHEQRDGAINDFFTEISILQTLKDAEAKNINIIHEAFNFHSQLWIVSDYCPGGSVHTLMKASKDPGLEECYIIAVARELAIALKHIHEVGIIHRDVKAANVLITEHGQLQLCDFGVAGVLESKASKRHTMIGTPFWMPPEMYDGNSDLAGYGPEVDCWAFGSTIYELATGVPPNFGISPAKLHLFLQKAPKLEGEQYSKALKEFVAYCLVENPRNRPTADTITKHPFVSGTAVEYPTSMLRELIERYAIWEQSGGERASLFNPNMGAQGPEALRQLGLNEANDSDDDWNFSTTDEFYEELDEKIDLVLKMESGEELPTEAEQLNNMSTAERAELEMRARRGERQMARLFDPDATYEYNPSYEEADADFDRQAIEAQKGRQSVIDLDLDMDMDMDMPSMDHHGHGHDAHDSRTGHTPFFIDEDEEDEDDPYKHDYNRQEKRATMGWTFPSNEPEEKRKTVEWSFPSESAESSAAHSRQPTQEWKFPGPEDTEETAAERDRRRTMEWSFAAAEPAPHRRTMEWSFDNANTLEESKSADHSLMTSPKASVDLRSPGRPGLKHSITAPGDVHLLNERSNGDIDTEPEIDLSIGSEPPSDVIIDPSYYYSRPSTGYSSTHEESFLSATTSDNDDPFRYEEATTIRRTQKSSLRGLSRDQVEEQRSSLHAHSQSEPNRGSNPEFDEDYNYASNLSSHTRGSSLKEELTDHAPSSQLSRAPSVKASMDSLRDDSDDEEEYSPTEPRRNQHMNGTWRRADSLVPPGARRGLALAQVQTNFDTGTIKRTSTLPARLMNGESDSNQRGRIRTRDLSEGRMQPKLEAGAYPGANGPGVSPLEEDAAQELVVEEIQRLLGSLNTGIRLNGSVLGSVRTRSTSSRRWVGEGTMPVR